MFLNSRDRLNRKGETARSLEDYRTYVNDLMDFPPFAYLMFCPLLITSDLF